MEVHCRHEYSEDWDTLLNFLLDNYLEVKLTKCVVEFKLLVKKRRFRKDVFKTYGVWIDNKNSGYATLYSIDHSKIDLGTDNSVKQETMNKLYKLERKLLKEELSDLYKTPEGWIRLKDFTVYIKNN